MNVNILCSLLRSCRLTSTAARSKYIWNMPDLPKPGSGEGQFRRIVHYPEEYTIRPLNNTHLAGRDPISGRVIAKGIGGGIKHKYHWIKYVRDGPSDSVQEEKVLDILFDGCRTARVALVGVGSELKYILATENMKAGDIIRTSRYVTFLWTTLFKDPNHWCHSDMYLQRDT